MPFIAIYCHLLPANEERRRRWQHGGGSSSGNLRRVVSWDGRWEGEDIFVIWQIYLLDTMEETLLQWNRLSKIDRSRKHANEVHVYSAFEWEILRSRMSRSIWDLACVVWFSFQVDAFCLAIGLHEHKDPKYHLNPLLVNLYPVLNECELVGSLGCAYRFTSKKTTTATTQKSSLVAGRNLIGWIWGWRQIPWNLQREREKE